LLLHSILTLADYLSETFRFFHIVLRASHLLIAGNACHNKVTPSGRSSTMAIYDATSCRTLQLTITPYLMIHWLAIDFAYKSSPLSVQFRVETYFSTTSRPARPSHDNTREPGDSHRTIPRDAGTPAS